MERTQLWSYIVGPIAKLCMCQFGPVKFQGGPKRGNSWKFTPPLSPLKIGSGKLVLDKKIPPDKPNALEWFNVARGFAAQKSLLENIPWFFVYSQFNIVFDLMPKNYEALLNISRDIRSQSMVWRKQRNSAFATWNDLIFQNQTLQNSKWNQWGYKYIEIRKLFKFRHNWTKNKALASF